jgi:integrase
MDNGLSTASVGSTTVLHSIFRHALTDRVITFKPCETTELPKVVPKARTLTPEEYDAILAALPTQHRLMIKTAIDTRLRPANP